MLENFFKIMRKLLFNYSFYSHPEIGNFRVWQRECLSIHSSLPLGPRHHAIPQNQRKQSLCRTQAYCRPQAPLSNLLKKPSFSRTDFFTKLGPQIRCLPVPNFGVNICPFNYGIKVILFRNWLQLPTSSNWICSTLILSLRNPSEPSSRSKP
jgi:hypothetical protein